MNGNKNYYEILGVTKDTEPNDIKKAYRKLAMKYHPDGNSDKPDKEKKELEEKFKDINEAYEILSDEKKKAHYDQFGTVENQEGFRDPRDIFSRFYTANANNREDLEDIINNIRGFRQAGGNDGIRFRQRVINPDIRHVANLSIKDVILGTEVVVELTRGIACDSCKTTGVNISQTDNICPECKGQGMKIGKMNGNILIQQTCSACGGSGKEISQCPDCKGQGYTPNSEKISVKIPKGIPPMGTLRIRGKGNVVYQGNNKIDGNLFIVVDYPQSEEGIRLKDGELYLTVKIPFNLMLSGEKIKINVLNTRKILFNLDPSKPSGYQYIIRNGGIENGKSAYIKVFADFPQKDISKEDRQKLIELMKEIYGESTTTFKPEAL